MLNRVMKSLGKKLQMNFERLILKWETDRLASRSRAYSIRMLSDIGLAVCLHELVKAFRGDEFKACSGSGLSQEALVNPVPDGLGGRAA